MEASQTPPAAPAAPFDTSTVHQALDDASTAYHTAFDGHIPDEIHRFDAFISTVRMIVDQSADSASKE